MILNVLMILFAESEAEELGCDRQTDGRTEVSKYKGTIGTSKLSS